MAHNNIFSDFTLKSEKLKSRLGLAPLTRMSSGEDSIPRTDVLDLLVARAKSGAGLVYTEAIIVDYESSQGYPGQSRILNDLQIKAWKEVTDKIIAEGTLPVMQMFHCGRMSWPEVNPVGRTIAPSQITPRDDNPLTGKPYPMPDEMTRTDMDKVRDSFVETALCSQKAGFKAIEVHCAHGYLLSQFLSNYSNKRSDEYGGTVENRFRFVGEVIEAVKSAVRDDTIVLARVSNWAIADMDVSLFADKKEWQELIGFFNKSSIDGLSLSTYNFTDEAFGTGLNMAELTREVFKRPIILCGGIYDKKTAEEALTYGDVVLSGKSMLLNPKWIEDVREGKDLKPFNSEAADVAYGLEPLP